MLKQNKISIHFFVCHYFEFQFNIMADYLPHFQTFCDTLQSGKKLNNNSFSNSSTNVLIQNKKNSFPNCFLHPTQTPFPTESDEEKASELPTPQHNHQYHSYSAGRGSGPPSDHHPNRQDGSSGQSGNNPNDDKGGNDEKKDNQSMIDGDDDIGCFPCTKKFTVCT